MIQKNDLSARLADAGRARMILDTPAALLYIEPTSSAFGGRFF